MRWEDYQAIGEALAESYPKANYLTISDAELVRLVTSLPEFAGGAEPPGTAVLSAVSFAWIAAAEGPDDSSPYEGAV